MLRQYAWASGQSALFFASLDHTAIQQVIDGFLGNPFEAEDGREDAAEAALGSLNIPNVLKELANQGLGGINRAKALILSIGHRQARGVPDKPKAVLTQDTVPDDVRKKLPRPMGDYLRIVMASARCGQALSKVRGSSKQMQRARRDTWAACFGDSLLHALELERVIRDHDVLILGETGTGKEAFARAIQSATPGDRSGTSSPTSAVNAAAIPDTLVESELFGHVKGAFTGATETRAGRIRSADGGCFFLDEVGDLPFTTQVKLLRVIETNDVYPLGSDTAHAVDVRYVAATHKDLEQLVEDRKFRRDLFQRLAGNIIRIPPLRERPDDIVEIAMPFVEQYLGRSIRDEQVESIASWLRSAEARDYHWQGNVRELQNALRNLLLGLPPDLGEATAAPRIDQPASDLPSNIANCEASMQDVSDWYLHKVLSHTQGNFTQTARILGVDRSTVRRRAKK